MKLIYFSIVLFLTLSFASDGQSQISRDEKIQRIKDNRAYFDTWDHWPSLRDKVKSTNADVRFTPIETEDEIRCESCSAPDPMNDPFARKATELSDLVVVGRVISSVSSLTRTDSFIISDLELIVEDVLKDAEVDRKDMSPRIGHEITVVIPGGVVRSEGHVIQAQLPNRPAIKYQNRYLFFLKYIPSSRSYEPIGLNGFDVTNRDVKPLKAGEAPARPFLRDNSLFINAMHAAAQNVLKEKGK